MGLGRLIYLYNQELYRTWLDKSVEKEMFIKTKSQKKREGGGVGVGGGGEIIYNIYIDIGTPILFEDELLFMTSQLMTMREMRVLGCTYVPCVCV